VITTEQYNNRQAAISLANTQAVEEQAKAYDAATDAIKTRGESYVGDIRISSISARARNNSQSPGKQNVHPANKSTFAALKATDLLALSQFLHCPSAASANSQLAQSLFYKGLL